MSEARNRVMPTVINEPTPLSHLAPEIFAQPSFPDIGVEKVVAKLSVEQTLDKLREDARNNVEFVGTQLRVELVDYVEMEDRPGWPNYGVTIKLRLENHGRDHLVIESIDLVVTSGLFRTLRLDPKSTINGFIRLPQHVGPSETLFLKTSFTIPNFRGEGKTELRFLLTNAIFKLIFYLQGSYEQATVQGCTRESGSPTPSVN